MRDKKLILILGFFLIFVIYIWGPYVEGAKADEGKIQERDYLNKDIIRFHVRANSDRKEDQALKLLVRDRVLDLMDKRLKDVKSVEDSREIILDSVGDIEKVSRGVVLESGREYDIQVNLGQEIFPLRKYGNLVFPQGEYESLTVEIGAAKGENWWCVMFPPLCFVDITHSVAIESPDEDEALDNYLIDETQPLKLKSKIFDWIKSMW